MTDTLLYHDSDRTRPMAVAEEISLGVPASGGYTASRTFYMTSRQLGRGTLRATFSHAEGALTNRVDVPFQVIEPIRRLVTSERLLTNEMTEGQELHVNPSRLVYGTNAVLKVSVNLATGDTFATTNTIFAPVSGPGRIVSQWRSGNDWYALVDGSVKSLKPANVTAPDSCYYPGVGAGHFKKTTEEVYANEK